MEDVTQAAQTLLMQVEEATRSLKLEALLAELDDLQQKAKAADFWQDSPAAQVTMKRIASLEARTAPWQKLLTSLREVQELSTMGDSTLTAEITKQLDQCAQDFEALKGELKYAGPYDN
jgi:Mg2+ and Co2+ transporter CorA